MPIRPKSKDWPRFRASKSVWSKILLGRTGKAGAVAFEACVRIGRSAPRHREEECGYGKNPRAAISAALVKVGRAIRHRRGAFAGRR